MAKANIQTKELTIKQRNGKSPDIHVIITRYVPTWRLKQAKSNKNNEPIDYGVTRDQFHHILDKASQPTKDKKSLKE